MDFKKLKDYLNKIWLFKECWLIGVLFLVLIIKEDAWDLLVFGLVVLGFLRKEDIKCIAKWLVEEIFLKSKYAKLEKDKQEVSERENKLEAQNKELVAMKEEIGIFANILVATTNKELDNVIIEKYKQLISSYPNSKNLSSYYNNIGNCYFRLENYEYAVNNYQEAIDICKNQLKKESNNAVLKQLCTNSEANLQSAKERLASKK